CRSRCARWGPRPVPTRRSSDLQQQFGIRRAVVPRVLSLAQVRVLCETAPVEIEVFGFGSLCVMVEGRCTLSSYVTGQSPNMNGRSEEHTSELQSREKLVCRLLL